MASAAERHPAVPALPRLTPWVAHGLMLASGAAGLGYQIVWTRQCALWIGHDLPAVLAVVAAFFGGLALGSRTLGEHIERSASPARGYAACEAVIGVWALLLAFWMAPVSQWLQGAMGVQPGEVRQWAVTFAGVFLLLLPATAAMGATLPAMARLLQQASARAPRPHGIASLYAANTAGALIGVLGTTFWTLPAWGLLKTATGCALLSLACAAVTWQWGHAPGSRQSPSEPSEPLPQRAPVAAQRPLLAGLAWSGLLGIGYEVLVVRVLSQVAENTVYTYALLLAVYLVGTAIGAAWARRSDDTPAWLISVACLIGIASLTQAQTLKQAVLTALGPGLASALVGEAVIAMAALLLPTVAMGRQFTHWCTRAAAHDIGWGRSLAWNTLGCALAPLVFGVGLLPTLGAKVALLAIPLGYLALCPNVQRGVLATLAATVLLGALMPPLRFIDLPPGGQVVDYIEGRHGSVSVVQDRRGALSLHIDNRQQEGSSTTRWADARQALLPLLLHPAPQRALFLGLGTGITATAATQDPNLTVDVVELLPEVAAAMHHFVDPTPRLHLHIADARRFVRSDTTPRYDLIVADNFHPARSGAGALYTIEHFRAVRERLAPGGLYCQWLPLHQMDLTTLRSIVASFLAVSPQASAILATNSLSTPVIGLVARQDGQPFDSAALHERLANAARWPDPPMPFGLEDDWAVLGSFIAGPTALRAFASHAQINTDDHPVVAYRAPQATYAPEGIPADRLITLLKALHPSATELFGALSPTTTTRLADYWQARDHFLLAGRTIDADPNPAKMLDRVGPALLQTLTISPDFRPAYDPLLALALAQPEPGKGTALLQALARLQPQRPEAAQRLAERHEGAGAPRWDHPSR